ncbi:Dihydroflavonol-4-reductase [Quillaja saponaria]|uniref:Dihydroflavonol-4-reductase n=1 Tax=Quillaja saponaria TaxID=32244 RepID=A0AAD7LQ74_QUISA|nr:Dihydroflavonol-4-reductase [Quillaja saponaria]
MEGTKGRVCVTGGTGHIASWLIMRLLENGYAVNTTIRSDPENRKDLGFLTSLPGASQNLQIFKADLSNPETFSAAIEGCIGVFHIAATIDFEEKEPEEIVTKRSVDATLGILKACLNSKTVKRVIYTSSSSAIAYHFKDVEVVDESFWSDVDFLRARKRVGGSYAISKTLTEKAALEFGEQNDIDVVTLLPSYVVGPFICPKLAGSVHLALAMAFGEKNYRYPLQAVHIDDVARAYIFLFEHSNPKGRYICSTEDVTVERIYKFLTEKHPQFEVPTLDSLKEIKARKIHSLSSKKLLDAGFDFKYGFDEMFNEAIQCCKEKGYL